MKKPTLPVSKDSKLQNSKKFIDSSSKLLNSVQH